MGSIELTEKQKEEIIKKARRRYKILYDAEKDSKASFVKNMEFTFNIGDGHWNPVDVSERDNDRRPHLTANKMAKFVRQVVNGEKSMPNADEVIPVDDKGDPKIAQIYNELINDIEYKSNAEEKIYGMAGEHAVAGGFGYWRVNTRWDEEGFEQQIIELLPCPNPLLVSKDPRGMYAFVRECIPEDEFETEYEKKIDHADFDNDEDFTLWYEPEKIWIAEYFTKEPAKKILVEFENPATKETGLMKVDKLEEVPEDFTVLRNREIDTHKIMWYKITGNDILDSREWMGSYIPIVEVSGHEVQLKGKTYKQALIEDAKDMNFMYDYWLTTATEQAAMTLRNPYMVTREQIKGHEKQWKVMFKKIFPYILFNQTSLGRPERASNAQIDPATLTMLQIADYNIKDTLGMFEASLGQQSNERSSKAITSRKAISDQGTFNFPYNFHQAKLETKRIIIDLIPGIYDNARIIRLRGKNENIPINWPSMEGKLVHDLSIGKYDIRSKMPFTPSRRQQIVDNFVQAMQYAPTHADIIFNFALKFMDVPGVEELSQAINQRTQELQQQQQTKNNPPGEDIFNTTM
jgi:hypothetical protein